MATIIKPRSPLATQPLKTSPATGATLASLGFQKTLPLMHGSQGCGAFSKVYLIQHLREPIPLQNTAIDQISAVMGGDENLYQALKLLCEKNSPELITVMTTGLTEMQGCDTHRIIMDFKKDHPQYEMIRIVSMATPDFVGSMQTGFAHAVDSVVKQLVQPPSGLVRARKQVNVLCSVGMSSADIETLKRYLEAFELNSIFVPDLSLSLDGHLANDDFSALSTGGTSVQEIELMSESVATIVIGESMLPTAKWLKKRFSIDYIVSDMGMGLEAMDELVMALSSLSTTPVPDWITRSRKRLQDAMLDTHFLLTNASLSLGLEPDLALGYARLLNSVGAKIARVVSTLDTAGLKKIQAEEVIIGDLSMLLPCKANPSDLKISPSQLQDSKGRVSAVISNTHAAQLCEPDIPVIRAGYPCHDQFGNMDIRQFGYEGSRERLFALANRLLQNHVDEVAPHISAYRFGASEVTQKESA